jgi:transposase
MRTLLARIEQEWKKLEIDIADANDEIERIANEDAGCRRLRQIPGVGPLVSTATVAAIGNGAAFRKGRDFAAWLGLVPRQHSTETRRSYTASVSAATFTCDACSFTAHAPCCSA